MAYNLESHVNKRKALREQLDAELAKVREKSAAMGAEGRPFTEEEAKEIESSKDTIAKLSAQINTLDNIEAIETLSKAGSVTIPAGSPLAQIQGQQSQKTNYARTGRLKNFKDEASAVRFGKFCFATIFGSGPAKQWCEENGIPLQAVMNGTDNSKGGIFVPEEFINQIIDLRERRGVFRENCKVVPMSSDSLQQPVRLTGLTAYWTADGVAVSTQGDKTWSTVGLSAKELVAETRYTNTLGEDAIISVAEDIAQEMAYAFALAEDEAGFNGDATSTYGGITGLKNVLGSASVITAATSHDSVEELTIADWISVRAKLPMYPGITPKWYCHKAIHEVSMAALAYAAGGNTVQQISGGVGLSFLGDPVVLVQNMNSTLGTSASTIKAYYGDLMMAAMLGDRRSFSVRSSDQVYFRERQTLIQATSRLDINIHQRGDSSNPGPMLALKTAA